MANKTDKKGAAQAPAKAQELTLDNIEEQIKGLNLSSEDIAQKAKEEQAKDDEKEKIRKTRRAQARSKYINMYSVIGMKYLRYQEHAAKWLADETKKLRDDMESGKITFNEFDKKVNDLFDERNKKLDDCNGKFRELKKELDDSFSNTYDTYDIDWKFDSFRGKRLF